MSYNLYKAIRKLIFEVLKFLVNYIVSLKSYYYIKMTKGDRKYTKNKFILELEEEW